MLIRTRWELPASYVEPKSSHFGPQVASVEIVATTVLIEKNGHAHLIPHFGNITLKSGERHLSQPIMSARVTSRLASKVPYRYKGVHFRSSNFLLVGFAQASKLKPHCGYFKGHNDNLEYDKTPQSNRETANFGRLLLAVHRTVILDLSHLNTYLHSNK